MGKVIDASFTGGRRDAPLEQMLKVCTGVATGEIYNAGQQEMVIGRSPTADVRVYDDLVSQHHAKLLPTEDGGHAIRDLGSSNGTFVNNELIQSKLLRNGDFIQVGDTVLQYISTREGEPVEPETVRRAAVPPALAQAAQMMMVRARHSTEEGAELSALPGGLYPAAPNHGANLPSPYFAPPPPPMAPASPSPATGEATEVELSFKDYFTMAQTAARFFMPHWKKILAIALLGALVGVGSFYVKPPPQRAYFEMSLMPDAREARVNAFEPGSVSFFSATEQNFKSVNLIQKTLADLGNTNPSDEFLTAIQTLMEFQEVGDPYDRTRTFVAAFSSKDGAFAVKFLQAHLENYLDTEIEKKLKVITVEGDFLRTQAADAKANLDKAQQAVLTFKQENIASLPEQARQYYELLFDLQRRQSDATKEIDSVKAAMDIDRARLTRESPLVKSSISTSRPYEQSIAEVNAKLAEARAKGQGEAHPEVIQLKKQLGELQALSQAYEKQDRGNEIRSTNPEYNDIRTTIRRLESQREMAKNEAARVEADLKKVKGIVESLPKVEAEYNELNQNLDAAQSLYKELSDKLKATRLQVELERASVAARYDIITQPRLDYFSPKEFIRKRASMGGVAGIMLAFGIVWLMELRKGNVLRLRPTAS